MQLPSNNSSLGQHRWLGLERQWWVLLAVGAGSFMGTLNTGIVNTILPVIQDSFGADLSSIEWVLMAYLLTTSILLLSFGRLGDIWGHKRVYNTGLLVFIVSSALCAFSPTEGFLIGARSLQAVGGAMVVANSQAILTRFFPPEKRGQLLGMLYTIAYLGILIGPSLGGYLAHAFGWRSVFLVNIIIGGLTMVMSWRILPDSRPTEGRERFDPVGAAVLTIGLGVLLLGISKGQELGWTSAFIIGCVVASAFFLVSFVLVERAVSHPMLDLALFRSSSFSFSTAAAFLNYMCVFSGLFLVPFYLIQGRNFSPSLAGLLFSAQPLGMVLTAPISGYLSDRIGSRLLSTLGTLIVAAGLFMLHYLGPASGEADILLPLALIGLGNGLFVAPNASAIMGSSPAERQGVAAGIVSTARNLGMVFGVALTGAILSLRSVEWARSLSDPQLIFIGAFQDTLLVVAIIAFVSTSASMVRGPARVRKA
ncbi:MAG: DHA2 family efflux MFS transporter permease subunit [Dehalococcoidia bacterium]|nr:DHA2 family efflux MFS transporter permease subunit [Dehalococcoidia bacterium]